MYGSIESLEHFGHGRFTDEELQDKCAHVRGIMDARKKPETPSISAVVPAYREEGYILATLLSLAQQTHDACEFIIVNNGEPENNRTHEICSEAGFNVIHEPRKGIARARDIGLRAAHGKIIASTDADTLHHPGWLETIDGYFKVHRCVAAQGSIEFIGLSVARQVYRALCDTYKSVIENNVLDSRMISGANSHFSRDFALSVGGYNLAMTCGEDTDIFERMLPGGGEHMIHDTRACVYTSGRRINAVPISRSFIIGIKRRTGVFERDRTDLERVYADDFR